MRSLLTSAHHLLLLGAGIKSSFPTPATQHPQGQCRHPCCMKAERRKGNLLLCFIWVQGFSFFPVMRMIPCYLKQPTSTARGMAERAVQKLILQVKIQEIQCLPDEGQQEKRIAESTKDIRVSDFQHQSTLAPKYQYRSGLS